MFDYITDKNLHWADMGEVYDQIIIGDKHYDFVKGVVPFIDKMVSYFPEERKAIEAYVDIIFKANKAMVDGESHGTIKDLFTQFDTALEKQLLES